MISRINIFILIFLPNVLIVPVNKTLSIYHSGKNIIFRDGQWGQGGASKTLCVYMSKKEKLS